jgi:hypothetical protein
VTILEIGREKIPENGWELNRWSHHGEKPGRPVAVIGNNKRKN